MTAYLEPTQTSGRALMQRNLRGPVVMLNLLRFRAFADYATAPALAPAAPISGADAYQHYVAHTLPYLEASGGAVLFDAVAGPWLIGPDGEQWDRVLLIRQSGIDAFMAYRDDAAYLSGLGHRSAALVDSRLLPMTQAAG